MTEPMLTAATSGGHQDAATAVEMVTFFEDRAEVQRSARVRVPSGACSVTLEGLALIVDDTTLLARVRRGNGRVLSTTMIRRVRQVPAESQERIAQLEREAMDARRVRVAAESALARIVSHERRMLSLMEGVVQAVARVPRGDGKISTWKGAYEALDRVTMETIDEAAEARVALDKAKLAESRAEAQLSLARSTQPRYEAAAEVHIDSVAEQDLELELTYRVPCALWRPEHVFRAVRRPDGSGFDLHAKTWATVWQATGEAWSNVKCRFSTARPARMASPPLLAEDLVRTRRKSDAERRQVVVETREQAVEVTGLARGARVVEEMPGVDDGGEAQWFEASAPTTIPSDGHPLRVEIGSVVLACEMDWVSYPERSEAVHVRATATLASEAPLLAGPAWVGRENELAGRSKIKFVARGEPFEVGLGPDDGLRVRRTKEEKRDTTMLTGAQRVIREVQVHVTNLGESERRLKVIERFPVSETDAVSVALLAAEGAKIDARDGRATFDVELPGNATKVVTLSYRIEAASHVVLPSS